MLLGINKIITGLVRLKQHLKETYLRILSLSVAVLLITACGGRSAQSPADANEVFVSIANDRVEVNEGESFTFNVQVVGGRGNYRYEWTVTPDITLTESTTPSISEQAPEVIELTEYRVAIKVTDDQGNSATDTAVLVVSPVNLAPVPAITIPPWPNYPANTYPPTETITLDGRDSSDPDAQTPPGINSFQWQQTAGPNSLTNTTITTSDRLVVTLPRVAEDTVLEYRLTVTDEDGETSTTQQSITVLGDKNIPPVIATGSTQTLSSGELAVLTGTASSYSQSAAPYDYQWTQMNGPSIRINQETQNKTFGIAPVVSEPTQLELVFQVVDANGNQAETSLSLEVLPPVVPVFNDTGIQLQGSSNRNFPGYVTDFPGQDSHRGGDRASLSQALQKIGDGDVGFDFTPLDENGEPITDDTTAPVCVLDNVTKLVWEVKTQDEGLRDFRHQYSWYSQTLNGGAAGELSVNSGTCKVSSGNCNTTDYVNDINTESLCGASDWRLPAYHEMLSLVHYGRQTLPLIDTDFFPNTNLPNDGPLLYWTSQVSADGAAQGLSSTAWTIDFRNGNDFILPKSNRASVRLVRGGR